MLLRPRDVGPESIRNASKGRLPFDPVFHEEGAGLTFEASGQLELWCGQQLLQLTCFFR